MEDAHDAREHLWRHVLIDLRVVTKSQSTSLAEDVISEANDFILIMTPLEKAVAGGIILAFPCISILTNHSIVISYFFLSLEWYIAEKHPDIFSLQ